MSRRPTAAVPAALLGLALGSALLVPAAASAQRPAPAEPAVAAPAHARPAGLPSRSVWLAKVRKKLVGADAYLDAHVGDAARPALVLDIDNTSLQTHYRWPKPVRPTLRVAKHAVDLGYTVFFVTGRTQHSADSIRPQLSAAGYRYADVYGRPKGQGLAASKQANRARIVARGYTVVMDIGNRATDLWGDNVGHGIKLPSFHGLLS
ncbi:HAD family acid phosphatase [Nocardioides sp. BP30]|uniref:HAD family acid phosphatase n=1 Tax=Nocardioides sp. BP30 TaxID=3036374 RepID=UPI0024686992|nr:HAD family acid phosphatase [Nocardioides sp. BP30]WGL52438.1 HAD family acid phosphatase [Nocardioides sp. BP30]